MMKKRKPSFFYILPQVIIDIVCIYFSTWLAMTLRLSDDGVSASDKVMYMDAFYYIIPWSIVVSVIIFALFKFYRTMWQFASTEELTQICIGVTTACAITTLMGYSLLGSSRFPNSVYLGSWLLILFLVGMSRFSFRFIHKTRRKKGSDTLRKPERSRVMVVGAGEMGSLIIKEMKTARESTSLPVCAIDDDRSKRGTHIHGVKVVGGRDSIPRMAVRYNVDQILLALPSATNAVKQDILSICAKTGCQLKTLPSLYEIMDNGSNYLSIRDVDIIDLLGRDETKLNTKEISGYLEGKTILVTGGGGTIGSELCRQIALFNPKRLIVFDIYENNAYDLQNELLMRYKNLNIEVIIGSVRDQDRVNKLFDVCRPDVVFHAAAHKHVPLMELSPGEAVKNNVFGTLNVARAADRYGAKHMVLISTDKAVNPTNVMGATKRICELIIQYFGRHSKNTDYAAVRFGNVLGSSGSVIPLFKRQIANGGPVTVTHPDIIRYFMTIPEAARLVIQAGGMAKGGEIFILDMGKPVKILDLAEKLIRLSGYEPGEDIEIKFTGLRPGEKLFEEFLLDSEGKCEKTAHELIYIGSPIPFNEETFIEKLSELRKFAGYNNHKMIDVIKELVPTYSGHADQTDLLAIHEAERKEELADN